MKSRKRTACMLLVACLEAALAHGQASQGPMGPATIIVSGDIPTPLALTREDLAKMPRQKVSVRAEDGTTVEYEGIPLGEVLKRAGAPMGKDLRGKALTSYILAQAQDDYQVVFTLAEVAQDFANESILLVDKRDGKPLPGNQGPFRLVCVADKAGARSVRMLRELKVVRLAK